MVGRDVAAAATTRWVGIVSHQFILDAHKPWSIKNVPLSFFE